MEKILIRDCNFLSSDGKEIVQGNIAIENGRIIKVGEDGSLPVAWQPDHTIDGTGRLCLPGLINCHTHAAMTLLRSYADDLPLMHWLEKKIWPVEDRLTAEDVYWGSMLALVEMIRSGTTTFCDMYFFEEETARAAAEIGIRGVLARGLVGTGASAEQGLTESRELLEKWQGAADGRITIWLGPHAPYTCPPSYLERVLALAEEFHTGIHIHLAETLDEDKIIQEQYGKSPTAYLNDLGVFQQPTLAAHCVHLNDDDIDILAERGVAVAHNPESNMKLASGIAPVTKLLSAGVTVGLGTDGASSNNNLDLFGEMRTAALLQKVNESDPLALPAPVVLRMATAGGAAALGISDRLGSLSPGYLADLILINLEQPHFYPHHNLIAHMVYAAHGGDVETVIVNGCLLMEEHRLLTVDVKRVMAEVERCAARLTGA